MAAVQNLTQIAVILLPFLLWKHTANAKASREHWTVKEVMWGMWRKEFADSLELCPVLHLWTPGQSLQKVLICWLFKNWKNLVKNIWTLLKCLKGALQTVQTALLREYWAEKLLKLVVVWVISAMIWFFDWLWQEERGIMLQLLQTSFAKCRSSCSLWLHQFHRRWTTVQVDLEETVVF